ncbi:hypothetical protein HDU76_001839 [Blyttiomyces sp. JEL0837]|nr:hypothetical protein HDU76_001839 [Blyttiomyces sp. JEL0837]
MDVKPKCKFGSKCYRVNPQHLKEYDHSTTKPSSSSSPSSITQPPISISSPSSSSSPQSIQKPKCPYGLTCYRKNPEHRNEYDHDPPSESLARVTLNDSSSKSRGQKRPREDTDCIVYRTDYTDQDTYKTVISTLQHLYNWESLNLTLKENKSTFNGINIDTLVDLHKSQSEDSLFCIIDSQSMKDYTVRLVYIPYPMDDNTTEPYKTVRGFGTGITESVIQLNNGTENWDEFPWDEEDQESPMIRASMDEEEYERFLEELKETDVKKRRSMAEKRRRRNEESDGLVADNTPIYNSFAEYVQAMNALAAKMGGGKGSGASGDVGGNDSVNPQHLKDFDHSNSKTSSTSNQSSSSSSSPTSPHSVKKPKCPYGAACYRANPQHRKEYDHDPPSESLDKTTLNDFTSKSTGQKRPREDTDCIVYRTDYTDQDTYKTVLTTLQHLHNGESLKLTIKDKKSTFNGINFDTLVDLHKSQSEDSVFCIIDSQSMKDYTVRLVFIPHPTENTTEPYKTVRGFGTGITEFVIQSNNGEENWDEFPWDEDMIRASMDEEEYERFLEEVKEDDVGKRKSLADKRRKRDHDTVQVIEMTLEEYAKLLQANGVTSTLVGDGKESAISVGGGDNAAEAQ